MKDLKTRAEGTCLVNHQMCEVVEAQVLTSGREKTGDGSGRKDSKKSGDGRAKI